jgi:ceramide glucosyltransferase
MVLALAFLALLSLALALWQWFAAARFPLHHRAPVNHTPAITVLKPLKGCDAETEESLRSWFAQEYAGEVQILFGVASLEDPVCPIVRRLIAAHPGHDAHWVVCPGDLGTNAKVGKLVQLARLARHDLMVVTDDDVRVPPDLLGQVVAPLQDPAVGLVSCFYRMANPANLAMRWEAFGVNADFWSQVLQARTLHMVNFALGAVMVLRRTGLASIGGFEALGDYLADDYQLGHRIAGLGLRVVVSPVAVDCWSAPTTWSDIWQHQLRWARAVRVCQPAAYFFSILSNATLWPLLWMVAHPTPIALAAAGGCLGMRMLTALWCEWRINRKPDLNSLWLAPLRDLLQLVLWAQAFTGSEVVWRGVRLRVRRDGRLVRVSP